MPPARSRALGFAVVASMLVAGSGLTVPVMAADSPEAAVEEFFDLASGGDLSRVGEVVCAADQGAVLEAFDWSAQLGLSPDDDLASALSVEISDRSIELVSEEGDTATVAITGTYSMIVPEDLVDDVVRAILEADQGPDDPPISDDEVQTMVGFMGSFLNQTQAIDEEVTVERVDDRWLICGGLVPEEEPTTPGFEPSVSSDGLCGLVSPQEMSTLGALQYDTSSGFMGFCSYSTSDYEDYHATSVSLELDQDVETYASYYQADQPTEVAGAKAFASGPDAFANQLLTQVGDDILLVSVTLPERPAEDLDWLTQATLVTELFLPRLADFRLELAGPTAEPTPVPTPQISLCEVVTLDVLNERTGLGFDEASGDAAYCGYTSTDGEPGFHYVATSLAEWSLDDYLTWVPNLAETSVGDQRALTDGSQLLVELPGGAYTLSVAGFIDPGDETASLSSDELLRLVAELMLPGITVPEPTISSEEQVDLEALQAFLEDPDSAAVADAGPALPRPMCEYLDLDAINALAILEYDTANSYFEAHCSLAQSDSASGYSELSAMQDGLSIEDVRSWYEDGTDVTVAGLPGFLTNQDLRVETSAGSVTFTALLPNDALEAGLQPSDILLPVAELVVAAIEAEAGQG